MIRFRYIFLFFISLISFSSKADNFKFNSHNNHGVIGLINTPSARFLDEGGFGFTLYDGTPDQKITITSSPYDWFEASFFYTNIQGKPYGNGFPGSYKDKGFNFKLRVKEEDHLPAIAIGINDIAGTGYYSSEYIVGSYGIDNLDMHFGIGWGALNGLKKYKNPLIYINDQFEERPATGLRNEGGNFQPSRYFSDDSISPFWGLSYVFNNNLTLKVEHDTTLTPGPNWNINDIQIGYDNPKSRTSFGLEYNLKEHFVLGISYERGNYLSLKFNYKTEGAKREQSSQYKQLERRETDSIYGYLINNLNSNGIGVNKIVENADKIGLELTQFSHPNLDIIEEIVFSATRDAGIEKDVQTSYKVADLSAVNNIDANLLDDTNQENILRYERKKSRNLKVNNRINFRPFIGAREGFLKFSILAENDIEYVIKDNFFFSSNIKYSLADNFDDLTIPPNNTYPAQVRSDVKEYLRNFDHPVIGRAQFEYFITPKRNHHYMFSAGILEEMFIGAGFEYLKYENVKSYAYGFEIYNVKKRDYKMRFGTIDYQTTIGSANFYYRNYKYIPFDAKISAGKYLAGDKGITFELSRKYLNGAEYGVFATFTDVSSDQFGEGSFDKGIFFNIPIYQNFINYTWRPLTKDPGARLNRKNSLYGLLVKFKPYNQ